MNKTYYEKMDSLDITEWEWWLKTMRYLREIPRKMYMDQLYDIAAKHYYTNHPDRVLPFDNNTIVDYLNDNIHLWLGEV